MVVGQRQTARDVSSGNGGTISWFVWSDSVTLDFVRNPESMELAGRKLAVSFHIAGESGPMTWHAKAMTTSYVSPPGSGALGKSEDEEAFPYGTSS